MRCWLYRIWISNGRRIDLNAWTTKQYRIEGPIALRGFGGLLRAKCQLL